MLYTLGRETKKSALHINKWIKHWTKYKKQYCIIKPLGREAISRNNRNEKQKNQYTRVVRVRTMTFTCFLESSKMLLKSCCLKFNSLLCFLSTAVINTITNNNLGGMGLSHFSPQRGGTAGTRQGPRGKNWSRDYALALTHLVLFNPGPPTQRWHHPQRAGSYHNNP